MKDCRGEVNLVGFGPYDIQITCGNWTIQTYAAYEYYKGNELYKGDAEIKGGREIFLNAVGENIENIRRIDKHKFSIDLSNGDKIVLIEDTPQYECMFVHKLNELNFIII